MFCQKCGAKLNGAEKFCPKCGVPVTTPPEAVAVSATAVTTPAEAVEVPATAVTTPAEAVEVPATTVAHPQKADGGFRKLACEMCGSNDLIKQDGVYLCQHCGMKYSVEEAKKMMIAGTVDVQGTVKVDNSAFVEKYLANARRAYAKEDWEEVEKYYNMVEQNAPNNMEAVFYSAFGKAMLAMTDDNYYKKEQIFNVLIKSISVINDYYEVTNEDKQTVLTQISDAITKMYSIPYVYNTNANSRVGTKMWHFLMFNRVKAAYVTELRQIAASHDEPYIQELITKMAGQKKKGCYVATAVYGSYDCPQVWTLRRFRDYTLAETWYGRAFIRTYYAISPTLVKWFGHTNWFKQMWKGTLDRMVSNLNSEGVKDTPYEDKVW